MAIVVTLHTGGERQFDAGERYEIDEGYLSVFGSKDDDVIATFAPPAWASIEVLPLAVASE